MRAADAILRKAKRLSEEIKRVRDALYNTAAKDPELRFENLKTYRVEMFRGFVLYMHLAIEDILKDFLIDFLRRQRMAFKVQELKKLVGNMRSAEIVAWCYRLKLITTSQHGRLGELNRIRNACSHNWLLDVPKYRTILDRSTRTKRRTRTPVVRFNNKNLFTWRTFSDEFLPVYGRLYLRLLFKDWKIRKVL
jgi:hypothetical protein